MGEMSTRVDVAVPGGTTPEDDLDFDALPDVTDDGVQGDDPDKLTDEQWQALARAQGWDEARLTAVRLSVRPKPRVR